MEKDDTKIKLGYETLWKFIIRPPKDVYPLKYLGPQQFKYNSKLYQRKDYELISHQGYRMNCSLIEFLPKYRIYIIKTLIFWFNRFLNSDSKSSEYYHDVRNFFIHISNICDFSDMKSCAEYNNMSLFINNRTYERYLISKILRSIFSFEFNTQKTRKIIHIAGFKFTIKN